MPKIWLFSHFFCNFANKIDNYEENNNTRHIVTMSSYKYHG